MRRRRLRLGVRAGLVAGVAVGLGEALFLLTSVGDPATFGVMPTAVGLYGAAGTLVGCGLGVVEALVTPRPPVRRLDLRASARTEPLRTTDDEVWSRDFVGVATLLGGLLVAWHLRQRLHGGGPLPGTELAWLALGLLLLAGVLRWMTRVLLLRTPLRALLGWRGSLGAVAIIFAITVGYAATPGPSPVGTMNPGRTQPAQLAERPNVVVVVVDALRADHVGPRPQGGTLTPHLDGLAADGVVFAQAMAQAPWTRPSVASMLSGMVPSAHTADTETARLPGEVDTLAEVLADAGYHTGGVVANPHTSRVWGFHQGFDWFRFEPADLVVARDELAMELALVRGLHRLRAALTPDDGYRVQRYYQPADVVLGSARDFIEAQGGARWFLWVHLMEPHDPYFEHPYNGKALSRAARPRPVDVDPEALRALYAGEVSAVDEELGGFLEWLALRGFYDDTVIVVTSDHGEELLDHGGWWHGTTLYDEVLHVPLVVKLQHQARAGEVVQAQVRGIDLAPTVAALAGVEPSPRWMGASALEAAAEPLTRELFAETSLDGAVLSTLRQPPWKVVRANVGNPRGLPPVALYDLGSDPGETAPASAPEHLARFDLRLHQAVVDAGGWSVAAEASVVDTRMRDRLEALGYMRVEAP